MPRARAVRRPLELAPRAAGARPGRTREPAPGARAGRGQRQVHARGVSPRPRRRRGAAVPSGGAAGAAATPASGDDLVEQHDLDATPGADATVVRDERSRRGPAGGRDVDGVAEVAPARPAPGRVDRRSRRRARPAGGSAARAARRRSARRSHRRPRLAGRVSTSVRPTRREDRLAASGLRRRRSAPLQTSATAPVPSNEVDERRCCRCRSAGAERSARRWSTWSPVVPFAPKLPHVLDRVDRRCQISVPSPRSRSDARADRFRRTMESSAISTSRRSPAWMPRRCRASLGHGDLVLSADLDA